MIFNELRRRYLTGTTTPKIGHTRNLIRLRISET